MPHVLHLLVAPAACGAALFMYAALAAHAAGLTGPDRAGFVDSALRECMKEALGNKSVPAAVTSQFCTCYAQGMADGMSNAELKSLEAMDEEKASAMLEPRMEAISKSCMARIKKR
jgi:hypothetical protein